MSTAALPRDSAWAVTRGRASFATGVRIFFTAAMKLLGARGGRLLLPEVAALYRMCWVSMCCWLIFRQEGRRTAGAGSGWTSRTEVAEE
jgi:hypothetical protein